MLRFGSVFLFISSNLRCGAVRFSGGKNPTVRFGAVEPHRTDRPDKKNRDVNNPAFLFTLFISTHIFRGRDTAVCFIRDIPLSYS